MPRHTGISSGGGRQAASPSSFALKIGDIALDAANFSVMRGPREVRLGPTEFRLLAFMMQNAGLLLSREQLRAAAWPQSVTINPRTVDVYIGRLRRALNRGRDRDPIRTVRYAGYIFAPGPKAGK